jgi:hypothetical protein
MRYIIRARETPAALAAFLDSIVHDPDIALVDTIGPPGHVHTAVIEVKEEKALMLERRLSNSTQLIIERDRPLSLYQ